MKFLVDNSMFAKEGNMQFGSVQQRLNDSDKKYQSYREAYTELYVFRGNISINKRKACADIDV